MATTRYGPIPKIHQPNTFTYSEWYDAYYDEIKELYYILKGECNKRELDIFDKMNLKMFVGFVYSKSDKRIPRWYKEERHRFYADEDTEDTEDT